MGEQSPGGSEKITPSATLIWGHSSSRQHAYRKHVLLQER